MPPHHLPLPIWECTIKIAELEARLAVLEAKLGDK
jgi:hypothetical protein